MQGVPAGGSLLQQVVSAQVVQQGLGAGQVGVGQRGGGIRVDVLAGVQRHQAQQPSPVSPQLLVGQVEGELHAGVKAPLVVTFIESVGTATTGLLHWWGLLMGVSAPILHEPARRPETGLQLPTTRGGRGEGLISAGKPG